MPFAPRRVLPATNTWTLTALFRETRSLHTSTLLPSGKVLTVGQGSGFDRSELYEQGFGFTPAWRPQINAASFDLGGRLVVTGSGFRGISGASGGNGGQDSSANFALVQIRRLDNEQTFFLLQDPADPCSATTFTSLPVSPFPGLVAVTVFGNAVSSTGILSGHANIAIEQPTLSPVTDGGTRTIAVARISSPRSPCSGSRIPFGGMTVHSTGYRASHAASGAGIDINLRRFVFELAAGTMILPHHLVARLPPTGPGKPRDFRKLEIGQSQRWSPDSGG